MISKRARMIILEIIKHEYVKVAMLSNKFKVSERTIRLDVEEIDYFLRMNGFDALLHYGKKGLAFQDTGATVSLIYKLINQKEIVTASYTREERLLEILYTLAMNPAPTKIDALAKMLLVSKSTVVKDLERMKVDFKKEKFQFLGTSDGVEIVKDEIPLRIHLVEEFMRIIDKNSTIELIELISKKDEVTTYKIYWRLFEGVDVDFSIHCVEVLKAMLATHLLDRSYLHVIACICFLLKRLKMGCEVVEGCYQDVAPLSAKIVDTLYGMLCEHIGRKLALGEKSYLLYLVYLTSNALYVQEHSGQLAPMSEVANQLILVIKERLPIYVDSNLQKSLEEELIAIYVEETLAIPPMKKVIELKNEQYQEIFETIQQYCPILPFLSRELLEEDYWRISWHFIANMEKQSPRDKKKVLLVSDKSKSLLKLLIDRLRSLFEIEIIGISGYAQLEKYRNSFHIDCIISTMKVELNGIEYVQVHPLLSFQDIARLKEHFDTHQMLDRSTENEFMDVVKICSASLIPEDITMGIRNIANHLLQEKVVSVDVYNVLLAEFNKQATNYFVVNDTLYLNMRSHVIVNKNYIIKYKNDRGIRGVSNATITNIAFIASTEEELYLRYLELNMMKEDA